MSLSRMTLKRLPAIKDGLILGLNREQIGVKCGVTEKTIDRDMTAWVDSGLFDIWIKEEFLRLHAYAIHEDPMEAYRQICKIVGKTMTRRVETKAEYKEEITHKLDISVFSDDEKSILDRAARILDRKSQGKSSTLH